MPVVIGVLEPRNHRGAGADELRQLLLGQARARAQRVDLAGDGGLLAGQFESGDAVGMALVVAGDR